MFDDLLKHPMFILVHVNVHVYSYIVGYQINTFILLYTHVCMY